MYALDCPQTDDLVAEMEAGAVGIDPTAPTLADPGSEAKLLVLHARAFHRLPLHLPGDKRLIPPALVALPCLDELTGDPAESRAFRARMTQTSHRPATPRVYRLCVEQEAG